MTKAKALTILLALASSSCGELGGSLEECAGGLSGTYAGDESGTISARLRFDGTFQVTFLDASSNEKQVLADTTAEGQITTSGNSRDVSGMFEFSSCDASGTWTEGTSSGIWTVYKLSASDS